MKKSTRIKKVVLPTVSNEIDPKDIPVADRGDWLKKTVEGNGFARFDEHPYRSKQKFKRHANGSWMPWLPIDAPKMKVAASRVYKAPPADTNCAIAILTGRAPAGSEAKWATEGYPVDVEFKNERIAGTLWQVASDFAECYEAANTENNAVSERRIYARQVCQFLRYRLHHLWRPLVDATVFAKTMADIGRCYGGNKEDSAKLGRQKVIDGLMLARETFWDLNDLNGKQSAGIRSHQPMVPSYVSTLGRKSSELPEILHRAANDNRKRIQMVA